MPNTLASGSVEPKETLPSGEEKTEAKAPEKPELPPAEPELTPEQKAEADKKASEASRELSERKRQRSRERWNEMRQTALNATARAEAAERELQEVKGKLKAPVLEEYDDANKFQADVTRHVVREAEAERLERDAKRARDDAEVAQIAQWREKVEDAKERFPDFEKVAYSNDVMISDTMVRVIRTAPNGADLAYELGKNPAEAARIYRLSAAEQIFELGAINARLSNPPPKKVTQAPEPLDPITGRGASLQPDPSKMSYKEFKAYREKGGKL